MKTVDLPSVAGSRGGSQPARVSQGCRECGLTEPREPYQEHPCPFGHQSAYLISAVLERFCNVCFCCSKCLQGERVIGPHAEGVLPRHCRRRRAAACGSFQMTQGAAKSSRRCKRHRLRAGGQCETVTAQRRAFRKRWKQSTAPLTGYSGWVHRKASMCAKDCGNMTSLSQCLHHWSP